MPDSLTMPSVSPRRSLFLSYARRDDEPFVARLHEDLAARGFVLWWDRRCMPNRGLTFLREIREAINAAQRLIFVFGPQSLVSDYVRAEWQYACSIGTPVMTVLRLGEYEQLPAALGHFDVIDFRDDAHYGARLATLIRQLEEPVAPLGQLLGVPELPPQFQPRATDLAALRSALLRDSREPVVLTAAGRRAGMQGMGGIGKSVLAAAVAREFDVRRAFPDGVVWVPLGQQPNLPLRLAEACRALGDAPANFFDAAQGRDRLGELLAGRACLLVLDDAWQLEHVRTFDALGPRDALLVTTRDERLLDEVGARKHRLDVLAPADASRLMAAWLVAPEGVVAPDAETESRALDATVAALPAEAGLVAQECGFLPLALALSAAQVRDGVAWSSVLEALREADLQYLDHPNGSVFRSIRISVEALEREDASHARHYLELAVFPQGAAVPEAAVRTLWQRPGGLNARTADKLLATLARRALVRLNGAAPRRTIQLHDLQHDFARAAADDRGALHANLLEAYRRTFTGEWPLGPDDGYYFQHLAAHLAAAGRSEELCALLTASPAWLEAQFKACTGDSQFAADLELALETPAGQRPLTRVLLLAARQLIHERVEAYSDNDLETLVHLDRTREALSHARLRPEPIARLRGLVRLHRVNGTDPELRESLLNEALATVPQLPAKDYRARSALSNLALPLFEANRAAEALEMARRAEGGDTWHYSRDELVAALEGAQRFEEAAAVARLLRDDRLRAEELLRVAQATREAGRLEYAQALATEAASEVRAAKEEGDSSGYRAPWRTGALQAAAELLGTDVAAARELWTEAIELILREEGSRMLELQEIARKLAPRGETELVLRAFAAGDFTHVYYGEEARGLVNAAAKAAQFDTALAIATAIEEPALRAQALVALLPALHAARDSRSEHAIAEALAAADRIDLADNVGRMDAYGSIRAQTLCMLAEMLARLDDPRAEPVLESALADARSAPPETAAEALAAVARSMTRMNRAATAEPLWEEALELAIGGCGSCWNLAVLLAECGDLDRALVATRQVEAENQPSVLESVAEAFADTGLVAAARRAVEEIDDPTVRSSTLGDVAKRLAAHEPQAARVWFQEALACHDWPLGFNLLRVAESPSCWTPELIEEALALLPLVDSAQYQLEALQTFLAGLAARPWRAACAHLLDTARRLQQLRSLADDLVKQAEAAIEVGDLDTALSFSRHISAEPQRSTLLVRIVRALAAAGDARAPEVARSTTGDARVESLEAVALAWARARHPEAAHFFDEERAADSASDGTGDSDAAVREVIRALLLLGDLDGALAAFAAIDAERERAHALGESAAALVAGGCLERGLQVAETIAEPIIRARALLALAETTGDTALFERALREAPLNAAPPDEAGADWIAALGDAAVRHSATDDALARRLFAAAQALCALIPDRARRSDQQELIARSVLRTGWFAEALAAARAVEDGRENDYGATRGKTVAAVAVALAKAGRATQARAAAEEADQISTNAIMTIVSQAPMMLPEGFGSEHRQEVAAILRGKVLPEPAVERASAEPSPGDWRSALEVRGVDEFLTALARHVPDLEQEAAGLALPALKEAARVAGWMSVTWRRVSEALSAPPKGLPSAPGAICSSVQPTP